jgi:predicted metal-dependent enzyme (double-stranded beta helix superfamily)
VTYSDESFVESARSAASAPDPDTAVIDLLRRTLADPEAVAAAMPDQHEDEILLFEDDSVSVWSSRFQPGVMMPPHEHRMPVHIGGVTGTEVSVLYRREAGQLVQVEERTVRPGEVLSLPGDAIHAVTAAGDMPSHALHVYLGPLSRVERALFDWDTGARVDFSMENFHAMQRPAP